MARKQSPDKKELAQYKALNELGLTPNAIAKRTDEMVRLSENIFSQTFILIQSFRRWLTLSKKGKSMIYIY